MSVEAAWGGQVALAAKGALPSVGRWNVKLIIYSPKSCHDVIYIERVQPGTRRSTYAVIS